VSYGRIAFLKGRESTEPMFSTSYASKCNGCNKHIIGKGPSCLRCATVGPPPPSSTGSVSFTGHTFYTTASSIPFGYATGEGWTKISYTP
jgi:hypothetical protein